MAVSTGRAEKARAVRGYPDEPEDGRGGEADLRGGINSVLPPLVRGCVLRKAVTTA